MPWTALEVEWRYEKESWKELEDRSCTLYNNTLTANVSFSELILILFNRAWFNISFSDFFNLDFL